MKTERNFATHPRTIRESFQLIETAYRKGRLIEGTICKEAYYCAFGACLTRKQRNCFRDGLGSEVSDIRNAIGDKNIKAMTGMSVLQLLTVIEANDGDESYGIKAIRSGLKNGSVEIDGISFRLGKAK